MLTKPKVNAQLNVVLAILKTFLLLAFVALAGCCFAIWSMMLAANGLIKLLGLLVFCSGLGVFYFALRIRIDITLFEHWDSLDMAELDHALLQIKPDFIAGRTLENRLNASIKLFKIGAFLCLVQIILLLIMALGMNV
jgi:hypothetical protein